MIYTVRPAVLTDTYAIHAIEAECFSTPWGREDVENEIGYENGIFLVACDEDDIAVGYVSLRYVLDEGYMNNIAVKREHRRKGIGAKLLRALERECRALGLAFVTLEVRESNSAARELYSSLGYEEKGIRRRFYRYPEEDAVLYTLTLEEKGTPV